MNSTEKCNSEANKINLIVMPLVNVLTKYLKKKFNLETFQNEFNRFDFSSLVPLTVFDDDCYTRKILYRCEDFELILIGWNMNQSSDFHDHAKKGCLMKILSGSIQEERILNDKTRVLNKLETGQISYIHNENAVHKLSNSSSVKQATSLHIYSPPDYITKSARDVCISFPVES